MQNVRIILQQNEHKKGTKELMSPNPFEFTDLCSIGLFTTDSSFCSQYQNDRRDIKCGCKWTIMEKAFGNALGLLTFVQKMGNMMKDSLHFGLHLRN